MFFRSPAEFQQFAADLGFLAEPGTGDLVRKIPFPHRIVLSFLGQRDRCHAISRKVFDWLNPSSRLYVWITENGIWPSSENLHLYYLLRQHYGDRRALHDAPGHEFLAHEQVDFVTFFEVFIQFGWGGIILNSTGANFTLFSHDEWIQIESETPVAHIASEAEEFGLKILEFESASAT